MVQAIGNVKDREAQLSDVFRQLVAEYESRAADAGRSEGLPAIASAAAGALTVDVFIGRGDALRAYRITVERTA